jgi:hypothetical protein
VTSSNRPINTSSAICRLVMLSHLKLSLLLCLPPCGGCPPAAYSRPPPPPQQPNTMNPGHNVLT